MIADLHTHTLCSDGSLSPGELIARATEAGVRLLAITDHDTLAAYQALAPGVHGELRLVSGIELSLRWRRITLHLVGLNFDPGNEQLHGAVARQQRARADRARRIGRRLARLGFDDALQGARDLAGSSLVGRPHFAEHLVNIGAVRDMRQAFKKYLGAGKAGDVRSDWGSLEEGIDWIRAAGGQAVLAHPAKYRLTRTRLGELASEFAAAGGNAIEVRTGRQTPDVTSLLAALAQRHSLSASCGSDFHHPDASWTQLGKSSQLPASCRPVWENW